MPRKQTPKKKPNKIKTRDGRVVRKLQQERYKSFRLSKRIRHSGPKLPGAFKLTKLAFRHLWQHKKLFGGIVLVYLLLTIVLVRGYIVSDEVATTQQAIKESFPGAAGNIASSVAVFGLLVSSTSSTDQIGSLYQLFLFIIFSLVIIWALRQTHAKVAISLKDAFYKSCYPLIQFILVLLVLCVQLLPIGAAGFLYSAVIASGVSTSPLEIVLWSLLVLMLVVWSIYLLAVSVFALYIVTLPDMTPIKALRSAKVLVQHRRWEVLRKLIYLPIFLMVLLAVIIFPVLLVYAQAAELMVLLAVAGFFIFAHSYIYTLYRELLHERT